MNEEKTVIEFEFPDMPIIPTKDAAFDHEADELTDHLTQPVATDELSDGFSEPDDLDDVEDLGEFGDDDDDGRSGYGSIIDNETGEEHKLTKEEYDRLVPTPRSVDVKIVKEPHDRYGEIIRMKFSYEITSLSMTAASALRIARQLKKQAEQIKRSQVRRLSTKEVKIRKRRRKSARQARKRN